MPQQKQNDLPTKIPLFPLSGAILLPNARLPLTIFEPRYIAMVDDALGMPGRLIGMVQPQHEGGTPHDTGCVGRIVSFLETENDRYQIQLQGVCRFKIDKVLDGSTPYISAEVSWHSYLSDLEEISPNPRNANQTLIKLAEQYLGTHNMPVKLGRLEQVSEEMLVNSLSILCPLAATEKQALLEAADIAQRRETLQLLLEVAVQKSQNGLVQ